MSDGATGAPDPRLAERVHDLEAKAARLAVLLETGRLLSSEVSLDRLLTLVLHETTRVLGAERSSLFLLDRDKGELWSKVAQGMEQVVLRFPVTRGIAGHVARTGEVVNIADAYADTRFNPEIDRGTGFRTHSILVVPMKNRQGQVLGVVQALNKATREPFTAADTELLEALATQAAISIEIALLYERIEALFDGFVKTIVDAIDARDPTTAGHSHRVAAYALSLARALPRAGERDIAREFSVEELRALRYASILHDVGKIGVREQVLCKRYTLLLPELALVEERFRRARVECELDALKAGRPADPADVEFYARLLAIVGRRRYPVKLEPGEAEAIRRARAMGLVTERQHDCLLLHEGNLTRTEWIDMASHVTHSYHILSQIPWPEPLARVPLIAWSHHEKLDGSGYPRGVKGSEVPFEGQILCVADIFDALTASDRPYKRSYTRDEARGILEDEARRERIDGRLVRAFFATGCDVLPPETPRPPAAPPPDAPL